LCRVRRGDLSSQGCDIAFQTINPGNTAGCGLTVCRFDFVNELLQLGENILFGCRQREPRNQRSCSRSSSIVESSVDVAAMSEAAASIASSMPSSAGVLVRAALINVVTRPSVSYRKQGK
jgi:hypothetical protein